MNKRITLFILLMINIIGLLAQEVLNSVLLEPVFVEVSIGDMESTTRNHLVPFAFEIPFESGRDTSLTQTIYLAEQIGQTGYITEITYRYFIRNSWFVDERMRFYMAITDETVFSNTSASSWIPYEEFTLVYDNVTNLNKPIDASYWHTFVLDQPFEYTGGNLVIMAIWELDDWTWGRAEWYNTPTPGNNRTIRSQQAGNAFGTAQAVVAFQPNIILSMMTEKQPTNVSLSSFTSNVTIDNVIELKWTTASENNIFGFQVLRNDTNISASATEISPIIPATNSSLKSNYSFTDTEVYSGKVYYYWIFIRNNDGSSIHTHSIRVEMNEIEIPAFSETTTISRAFPNPIRVGETTNFIVDVKENEIATLQMFNVRGQLVHEVVDIQQGNRKISWNGRDINNFEVASGVYFYRLSSPSTFIVQRMVIVR